MFSGGLRSPFFYPTIAEVNAVGCEKSFEIARANELSLVLVDAFGNGVFGPSIGFCGPPPPELLFTTTGAGGVA